MKIHIIAALSAVLLLFATGIAAAQTSDDFSQPTLNTGLWSFSDPINDSSYQVDNGVLTLSVAGGVSHDLWRNGNYSVRVVQAITDGDFQIEAKFLSVPLQPYQLQGLLIESAPGTYVRLDYYHNGEELRVFSTSFVANIPTVRGNEAVPLGGALWLRLRREGIVWTCFTSLNGTDWSQQFSFEYAMNVTGAGVYGGNVGSPAPAFDVLVDYFFDTSAPIEPEDGGIPNDTTAPLISGILTDIGATTADISWTTDELAVGGVLYGLTPGHELGLVAGDGFATDHQVQLSNLTPQTLYYFQIESEDASGNLAQAPATSLSTLAVANMPPTVTITSPTSGADFFLADMVPLAADASDNDGSVQQVEFLVADQVVATVLSAPWEASWSADAIGAYTITARATDDEGAPSESAPVSIAVYDPAAGGAVLSDDFFRPTLNQALWTFSDPVGDSGYTLANGLLTLSVAASSSHDLWRSGNDGARVLQTIADADFEIEVKFESLPTARYQMQGLLVQESTTDYIRLDFVSDGSVLRVFGASFVGNNPTVHTEAAIGPTAWPLWLRLNRQGDDWLGTWSENGTDWQSAASFTHPMTVNQVGVFGGNTGRSAPAFDAVVDYFFNTSAPIIDEDGGELTPPLITSAAVTTATVGVSYSYDVEASGNPVPAYALTQAPAGMNIDSVSGLITWTPSAATDYDVTVTATNSEGQDSQAFTITVNDPGTPARVTAGLVALYDFAIAAGLVVPDVSGVGTPLDLDITDPGAVSWLPGGGLSLNTATVVESGAPASKVIDAAVTQNAMTVEAWLTPATVAQNGPARIVSCSGNSSARNITLGQGVYNDGDDRYTMRFRTTVTSDNGEPATSTAIGSLTTALTHVVYTRTAAGATSIYLDGDLAATATIGGDCSNWATGYALVLGNEIGGGRPWLGTFDLVAIYDRALPLVDILQNYNAGPRVESEPAAPVILSPAVTIATVDVPYSYDVDASGSPAPLYALTQAPTGMTIDPVTGLISWIPPAVADYDVTVTATNSEGQDSQAFTISAYAQGLVQIQVWHGPDQRVGHLGPAQADFNVLGKVNAVEDLASLSYKINGGSYTDLSVGPDLHRLANEGDFNADIPITQLNPGLNVITIRAISTAGPQTLVTVDVTKETGGSSSLPVAIDWSSVGDPQDVGQYVDGHWQKTGDGLRVFEAGYDRLFLIGEDTWQDYEVLVPITIHDVLPGNPSSGAAGLGILMRFTGHIIGGHRNWPVAQPKWGYQPFGGIGWLRWADGSNSAPHMQFYYGDYDTVDDFGVPAKMPPDPLTAIFGAEEHTKNFGKAPIEEGGTYFMRMQCETMPDAPDGDGVTIYKWKIWGSAEDEPASWIFQVTQESQFALRRGGFTLLAHHVEATFGDVMVTDLGPPGMARNFGDGAGTAPGGEISNMTVPRQFALHQNVPNPFNPSTSIALDLPAKTHVDLKVYDLRGHVVRRLFAGELPYGTHTFSWNGRDEQGRGVPGGVYVYRITSPALHTTRKMTLIK